LEEKEKRMNNIEIKYIGCASLLGRLSKNIKDKEDLCCIEMAMNDLVEEFPERFKVVRMHNGFHLEVIKQNSGI